MSHRHRLLIIASAVASALAIAAPAHATLTLLSSSRSASATAHADDGSSHLTSPPPVTPDVSASNSTNVAGPFNYSTGTLAASGNVAVPNPDYVYAGQTAATASSSLTSALSTTGFSANTSLAASATDNKGPGFTFLANASAASSYTTSFTVDVPTSFTFTAHYSLDPGSPFGSGTAHTLHAGIVLTDFLNVDLTSIDPSAPAPGSYSFSGTFLPGTTYTLSADLSVSCVNGTFGTSLYGVSGSMDFNLSNLTVVPEPVTLSTLALSVLTLHRRRRRP